MVEINCNSSAYLAVFIHLSHGSHGSIIPHVVPRVALTYVDSALTYWMARSTFYTQRQVTSTTILGHSLVLIQDQHEKLKLFTLYEVFRVVRFHRNQ